MFPSPAPFQFSMHEYSGSGCEETCWRSELDPLPQMTQFTIDPLKPLTPEGRPAPTPLPTIVLLPRKPKQRPFWMELFLI